MYKSFLIFSDVCFCYAYFRTKHLESAAENSRVAVTSNLCCFHENK